MWRWIIASGRALPSRRRVETSHSQCRVQPFDHGQGVLFLVEIVDFGQRYSLQCLLPSVRQFFCPGEIAGARGLGSRIGQKIERPLVEDLKWDCPVPAGHGFCKTVTLSNVSVARRDEAVERLGDFKPAIDRKS